MQILQIHAVLIEYNGFPVFVPSAKFHEPPSGVVGHDLLVESSRRKLDLVELFVERIFHDIAQDFMHGLDRLEQALLQLGPHDSDLES